MPKKLTAYDLKIIAIFAMILDHLAHIVVCLPIDPSLRTVLALIMNSIGRITMPIMCFFIAEGYHYTKDIRKYLLRLLVFAIILWKSKEMLIFKKKSQKFLKELSQINFLKV